MKGLRHLLTGNKSRRCPVLLEAGLRSVTQCLPLFKNLVRSEFGGGVASGRAWDTVHILQMAIPIPPCTRRKTMSSGRLPHSWAGVPDVRVSTSDAMERLHGATVGHWYPIPSAQSECLSRFMVFTRGSAAYPVPVTSLIRGRFLYRRRPRGTSPHADPAHTTHGKKAKRFAERHGDGNMPSQNCRHGTPKRGVYH